MPPEINRGHDTEKAGHIFLNTLGMHLVLRFGDDGLSGLFTKCSKEQENKKLKNIKSVKHNF